LDAEAERLKEFLINLPVWCGAEPGFFKKLTARRKGLVYKTMVFVGEGREPTIAYLPYDTAHRRLIIPGSGYYYMPIKGEIAFFDYDKCLPLVDAPNPNDKYQLPAHFLLSHYNLGLNEGLAQRFDELLENLQRQRLIILVALGVAALSLLVMVFIVYSVSRDYASIAESSKALATSIANQTAVAANQTQRPLQTLQTPIIIR
jgi:hypothetical protein